MYHPGPDAAFSANLREVDFGYWTGRHVQEVRADPVARAAWDDMSIDYVWGDAESFALAHRRAEAAIADYVRGARVADIVVVTHGLIIQLLLSGWLCGSPASANRFSAANGSVSVVDFDGHHVVLRASNLRPAELFEYGERARAAIGVATTVRSEVQ
jgi:broad specificity phosphatase PhoE